MPVVPLHSRLLLRSRLRAGLSQEELAEAAGVGVRTIREAEAGRARPRQGTVRLLAAALGLSEDERVELIAAIRGGLPDTGGTSVESAASDDGSSTIQSGRQPAVDGRSRTGIHGPMATPTGPSELPAELPVFTGRGLQQEHLDHALAGSTPGAVVIVSGTAGVGKTTLAVHRAHRVVGRFPDGQLYANLHGFSPESTISDPAAVLHRFLDALGVASKDIPSGLDARAALYRSVLAGKRVLVILDNARDAGQVRPLLPGSPTCLTVVTSRNPLPGLVASHGARSIGLDLLSDDEADALLRRRIGDERADAEPAAVRDLIDVCAGLPLALAVVGARAAVRPGTSLATLAEELDARHRLDAFTVDDDRTDVRTVFSWSYRLLDDEAARLFRLLGSHPGPDVTAPAAASLAGIPLTRARALLATLSEAQLIIEPAPGRYGFHDLLRAFATELTHDVDGEAERNKAVHRLLDHYLHTAYKGFRLIAPTVDTIDLAPPLPGVRHEPLRSKDHALDWFRRERRALLNAIDHSADNGFDAHTWQLTWSIRDFLNFEWGVDDLTAALTRTLEVGRRLDDPWIQLVAHRNLATNQMRVKEFTGAETHLGLALEQADRLGDVAMRSLLQRTFCQLYGKQGRYAEAIEHGHRAIVLAEACGDDLGRATGLNNLGWYYTELGRFQEAVACAEQALALADGPDLAERRALIFDTLGFAKRGLGLHAESAACHRKAIALSREAGNRSNEAIAWENLGDTHIGAGNTEKAFHAWHTALALYESLGHVNGAALKEKIARADVDGPA